MFGILDFSKPIVDFSNFEFSQLGDALVFGGAIMLIGMVTIFAILCLLWLCLILFRVFFHDIPEKRLEKKQKAASLAVSDTTEETNTTDDSEIIAVIAAAIAMAESEDNGLKFRVVSFRRV
jgi:Na+-transporting methylmalonyl-CoA/oxaloacetate decarboxylase gamma subunit